MAEESLSVADIVASHSHRLNKSPTDWTDGHILGNGDIGAVVWATPERLSVGFSKHDIWELTAPLESGARTPQPYSEYLKQFAAGQREALSGVRAVGLPGPRQVYQLGCGILDVELLRGQPTVSVSQKLSFLTGTCQVIARPSPFGAAWDMSYSPIVADCFVSTEQQVVVLHFESEVTQQIGLSLSRPACADLAAPVFFSEKTGANGLLGLEHPISNEERYVLQVLVQGGQSIVEHGALGARASLTFGGNFGGATLFVSLISRREQQKVDLKQEGQSMLTLAASRGFASIADAHRRWWSAFWETCAIDYSEPALAQLWYMGIYALASCTRQHTSPPNLQGIWNLYNVPPWHTDFHLNINVQESLWSACRSNHPELQRAFVRCLIHDWRDQLRTFAREEFAADGLCVPFCLDPLGRSLGGWLFDFEMGVTAWAAQHVWWQWLFERDEAYLREEAEPFLRECCEFYLSVLVEDESGRFNLELTHSPEQTDVDSAGKTLIIPGRNSAMDLAFLRELLANYVEAVRFLEDESDLSRRCEYVRANLPSLPTKEGVLIDYETSYYPEGDRPGDFPVCHRHASRLAAIYPCQQIGLHSSVEELALGRRSFLEFRSYGEETFAGWTYPWMACLAASLGWGETAEEILHDFSRDFTYPGLLSSHNRMHSAEGPLFEAEALLGFPAALNEMLLQERGGTIFVFPALPEGRRAWFHQLRTAAGVLVSAKHDGEGVVSVQVQFWRDAEVRLRNPFRGRGEPVISDNHPIQYQNDFLIISGLRDQVIDLTLA